MPERTEVTITMTVTPAQAVAIEDLLAQMNYLAGVGSSRWVAFFADGDGNFRPKATINGRKPEFTTLVPPGTFWKNGEYRVDFDWIALAMRNTPTPEAPDA